MSTGPLNVLIASWFDQQHADRIAAVDPRIELLYEPDLLPVPRYVADHHGQKRDLSAAEQARWDELVASAEVMLDIDFLDPATLPERAPNLRWVQMTSAGIGEFMERFGLRRSHVQFTTAAGVHRGPLTEFVLLGLLYVNREVPYLQREQAAHSWRRYTVRGLAGQRALVVGLGEIGREVARVLSTLGMDVWGLRRSAGDAPPGVSRVLTRDELREALSHVDALVLAAPMTDDTRGMIGEAELAALPQGAVIVNIGRGGLVDEPALIRALQDGRLGGLVTDVAAREPLPEDSPLWDLPNVLISPHSAATAFQENDRILEIFTGNLRRYLDGRPLHNRYEPDRGY